MDVAAKRAYVDARLAKARDDLSTVLGLYQERRISAGKAAELLGMDKREFVRLLARKEMAYFDYSDQELEDEFRAVDEWRVSRTVAQKAGETP